MEEADQDSDATTCDSDWYNEGTHIVPDSLGDGGDTNCTVGVPNHRASVRTSDITLSSSTTTESGTPPLLGNLDSTKYYEGEEGKVPGSNFHGDSTMLASPLSDAADEDEECIPPSAKDERESLKLSPCVAFDDHLFERPRFAHSPINPRRPLNLSSPSDTQSVEIPAVVNQYLRDYQQDGVRFLYDHFITNTGAVLCDDMGLGKTVQVIAFMCSILRKTCTRSDVLLTSPKQRPCEGCFLVICPGSVIYNWTEEIETWSHLKYGVYHRDKKMMVLDKVQRRRLEVVLTTHETARAHVDHLNTVDWLAVICDEVQVLKGTCSQVTAALNSLNVTRRYGLTGTALQNNLSELWSILNWVNPMCLGTLNEFQTRYEKPILEGQKYNCTKRQLAMSRKKLDELEEVKKKFVLRRTKSLIASQLPHKEEFVVFCPISELQEEIYGAILETKDVQLILQATKPCDCYSGKKRGECCFRANSVGVAWQKLCNPYTMLLTKCANHLGLLLPGNTSSKDQQDKARKVCEEVFQKHPKFTKMSHKASFMTLSSTEYCGKMQILEKLLETFHREKDKVIIFSMSVKLLNIIEDFVVVKNYVYSRLDGATKIEDRSKLVHTFNSNLTQFIFLISKKCGGVGLNVTGANRVIIFDPSWNPATDQQAEDRAFRIGQSRDVKVFRLITEGTVEEMIYLRQVYKQQLANMTMEGNRERRYFTAVAGDKNQKGELFGYGNLFPLRRPGQPGLNLTIDILKRVDRVEAGVKMAKDQVSSRRVSEENVMAKQVCDTEQSLLPGMVAIAHSGGRSVVGNSEVEEHLSREAQSAVLDMQKNSQEPANYTSNKLEGISDESDDLDFQPPTPKKKLCGTRSSRNQSRSISPYATASEEVGFNESEETKTTKRMHFEEMATQFGFSSPHKFAVHVTNISKDERERLLEEFYGHSSSKKRSRVKSKAKLQKEFEEDEDVSSEMRPLISEVDSSNKKKQNRCRSQRRTTRPVGKRKGLQFEEESPPKKLCDKDNSNLLTNDQVQQPMSTYPSSSTVALAMDTSSACDEDLHDIVSSQGAAMSKYKDETSKIIMILQDKHDKLHEKEPSHFQKPIRSNSLNLASDCNSLVDSLFHDSDQVESCLPHSKSHDHLVSSSPKSEPSVSTLAKVKQQSDFKSAVATEVNIDELLFGF